MHRGRPFQSNFALGTFTLHLPLSGELGDSWLKMFGLRDGLGLGLGEEDVFGEASEGHSKDFSSLHAGEARFAFDCSLISNCGQ